MSSTTAAQERFLSARDPPLCSLDVKKSFDQLSPTEKQYTYHLTLASWAGARIIQAQFTPEATDLYDLLIFMFSGTDGKLADLKDLQQKAGLSTEEFEGLLQYSSQALSNLVNFRSLGYTKIVPRTSSDKFAAVVKSSANATQATALWSRLSEHIYATTPEAAMFIGKPTEGHVSNLYFGETILDNEVAEIQTACENLGISILNTRVVKHNSTTFTLLVASAKTQPDATVEFGKGSKLTIRYGDMAKPLAKAVSHLYEAKKYAQNAHQIAAIEGYIKSFESGSIADHVEASTHWVNDVGPVVESYIGFVETYLDPWGRRAEWQGFTAIVNKALSAKYETLVDRASHLIQSLPWGPDFEVDVFRKPDFTALEVVSFATGDIPIGFNLPNYFSVFFSSSSAGIEKLLTSIYIFQVRDSTGFKNISLANIVAAKVPGVRALAFIHPDDAVLYNEWDDRAFELLGATHELLGHGTGKLFQENAQGEKNFDQEKITNPLTGKPITSWYKPGQTPGTVLGEVASSMEECRAEAVALYLASNLEILSIFKYTDEQEIEDIQYISFLLMARAGLRALEYYNPATKKHGQAHFQARFGIMQHLLRSKIVTLEEVRDEDGALENLFVHVDRSLVLSEGKIVMGKLLIELQVRKSTADGTGAQNFYTDLTTPMDIFTEEVRNLVLSKKLPRKIFVQPNLFVVDGDVQLKEYPLTLAGVIESWVERKL
ncbi:aflatoxin-detoxifizyme [Mycena rebaudengoi]|nr:aflatoxin-detoxifizyme [Mycena rebaudengoi]